MIVFADLADPASQLVQAGIKRHCGICHARPHKPCRNTIAKKPDVPLSGRVIHIERATRPQVDKEPVEKDGS